MRFVPGILSVLLLCAGSVSALAADARIGFVDMRVVMSKSKVADKAKKSFEQSVSVESKKSTMKRSGCKPRWKICAATPPS